MPRAADGFTVGQDAFIPRGGAGDDRGAALYERSDTERAAAHAQNRGAPADRCNLVWIILFMQGMGSLFGWNMFITAESFFSSRLDQLGTRWGACVGLYITLVFQITNIVTQLCCAMFRIQRIFGALLLQTAIFVFCLVLVQLEHLDQDTYFILLLSAVALDGAATAVMNAGVYGISGGLPSQFTGAVMQGQAIAGVVPAAAAIVARTVAPGDDKQSAIIYFSVAIALVACCLVSYLALHKMPLVIHHNNVARLSRQKSLSMGIDTQKSFWPAEIWREIRSDALAVGLVFALSLSLFPTVASNVVSYNWAGTDGAPNVQWLNFYCFLLFNCGDYTGRALASQSGGTRDEDLGKGLSLNCCCLGRLWMSTKRLWGLTIVRLGLLAAFLLCNLHNTKLPVVFKNDAFPVAFMVVLSVTNGFCGTVGMSLGPNKVEPGDRGVAGMMMAFSLALGIAVGIWSSFALSYFYTGKDPFCFSA